MRSMSAGVLLVVAAACGGGGLSESEFTARANEICRQLDDRLREASKGVLDEDTDDGTAPSAERLTGFYTDVAIPAAHERLDRLDDLRPPDELASDVDGMLAAGRKAIGKAEAAFKKDPVKALSDTGPDPFAGFNTAARDLGLGDCAPAAKEDK